MGGRTVTAKRTHKALPSLPDIRVGIGYDLHRRSAGRALILGGVPIPASRGCAGHSDADCLLHALCDAIFGALGEDDIGSHFPDTDPAYAGWPSEKFVEKAVEILREKRYHVGNVDCIVIAETPKFGRFKDSMRREIGRMLGLEAGRVAVKAKTGERVGAIGREEAIAAIVTVLIIGETES